MNWMGGNLSRHRRGKGWKEDMARQKEYFAKARSRQRDGTELSPVPLSAANFIPNYASPSEATTSLAGAGYPPSTRISKPSCVADGTSTSLNNLPKASRTGVTEPPLIAPLGKKDGFLMLDQSSEDHSIVAAGPEGERWKSFRTTDSAGDKLPNISAAEPARKRENSTHFRRTFEKQKQPRTSTGHHKVASNLDRRKGIQKRRALQVTSSPTPRSVRIRVGSQDYRWSEAKNSIGNPTLGDHSATQGTVSGEIKRKTQSRSVSTASYSANEAFTDFSPSSSDLPWSSPCETRAARRQAWYNPSKKVVGADSAEFQRPLPDCACGAVTKPPSSTTDIESTDSIAVQVSDGEVVPETETEEELIWKHWLG